MKKLHTILMTLILLLSIGVHAAPVAHNNAATQVKSSGAKASVVFMIAAGGRYGGQRIWSSHTRT
jgi:hypothetical protein